MIRASLVLALTALARNKMRSLLTTLGVVIGVAAVIMMQAIGRGATAYVGDAISGLGSNMLLVVPGTPRGLGQMSLGVPLFTSADLDAIQRQAHDVELAAAAGARSFRVIAGARNRTVNIGGVSPEYFRIRDWGASSGRLTTSDDERRAASVCILGQTVADELFDGRSPLGAEVRVRDFACRVVGVMEPKGAAGLGADQDDVVFLPFSTFSRRLLGTDRIGLIMASAVSTDRIDDAKEEIARILRRRRHVLPGEDDDFAVRDPRELQTLLETVTGTLTALLASVAAISLVVGGIGIMNIMLVSVTERTREIGIRLAIGARTSDVLTQFLFEATVLSGAGGALGVAVGLLAAWGAAQAIHVPFVVPTTATPIAFGVSVLVGIVFGVFPARKAARLHPLAALRFE